MEQNSEARTLRVIADLQNHNAELALIGDCESLRRPRFQTERAQTPKGVLIEIMTFHELLQ